MRKATALQTAAFKKMIVSDAAKKIADETQDAYSADRYNSWEQVAKVLLKRGYDARQTEAIMRSKWTRWAADASSKPYGKVPAKAVLDFLDKMTNVHDEVVKLTAETFA